MVKINPKSKIWFLTRIGKDIEWRIEKRKRICLQNLILSRSEREFFSKSRISRGEREFVLQNLDNREHHEKWKLYCPLEIKNLVNVCVGGQYFRPKRIFSSLRHLDVSHHVGHHNVISMLCEGSDTLTEWTSESMKNERTNERTFGWTDRDIG